MDDSLSSITTMTINSNNWKNALEAAQKTVMTFEGKKSVHYYFDDNRELIEVFDIVSETLISRKWKRPRVIGGASYLECEVGDDLPLAIKDTDLRCGESFPVCESNKDTYSITVDDVQRDIVVRTTNKKYFKRIKIPDLQRFDLPIHKSALKMSYGHNTLLITYAKPSEILSFEKQLMKALLSAKDGPVTKSSCSPS